MHNATVRFCLCRKTKTYHTVCGHKTTLKAQCPIQTAKCTFKPYFVTENGLCPRCRGVPVTSPSILDSLTTKRKKLKAKVNTMSTRDSVSSMDSTTVDLIRQGSQRAFGGVKRLMTSMKSNHSSEAASIQVEEVEEPKPSSGGEPAVLYPIGSQRAMGEVKRLMTSIKSNRSSKATSIHVEEVEMQMPSPEGEPALLYPTASDFLADRKALALNSPARHGQTVTEDSSAHIPSRYTTTMKIPTSRAPAGYDFEPNIRATTWPKASSQVDGAREERDDSSERSHGRLARIEQLVRGDERLVMVSQAVQLKARDADEKYLRADEHLARVRDGRGYKDYSYF